jgi:DNA-binding HxlR family transcriptional regulator
MLRLGRGTTAGKQARAGSTHRDGALFPPANRRAGTLDWRDILRRLAPVRHRWDLAILANLAAGSGSPADLLERINDQAGNGRQLSPQVLSGRLRQLEEAGYVGYAEISRIPRRREYWLMPRGRCLLDALNMLHAWYETQGSCEA